MENDNVIKTFLHLTSINSPPGQEEDIMEYLFTNLKTMALHPVRDSFGNMIVKIPGIGEPLLLSAHVDNVEPCQNINAEIHNGFIQSDGNSTLGADNKVAVAAIMEVIRILRQNNSKHRTIEIVFTRSEEVGNYGAVNFDYSVISAKKGYSFDNCEPIGTIVQASPFYYRFDLKIIGEEAHASTPEEAINVLPVFVNALRSIKLGKVNKTTNVNIGVAKSGYVRNTIPGEIDLKGEVRSFIDMDAQLVLRQIGDRFHVIAKKYGCRIEFSFHLENNGYYYRKNDPHIRQTLQIMREKGIQPQLEISMGCSDANIFKEHGLSVLDLGEGVISPRTTEEKIAISDLKKLVQLIMALVNTG